MTGSALMGKGEPMKLINADALLDTLKKEREGAITWRDVCAAFENTKMVMVAEQAILTYNKAICLINGLPDLSIPKMKWQEYAADELENVIAWQCPNCEEVVETKWDSARSAELI